MPDPIKPNGPTEVDLSQSELPHSSLGLHSFQAELRVHEIEGALEDHTIFYHYIDPLDGEDAFQVLIDGLDEAVDDGVYHAVGAKMFSATLAECCFEQYRTQAELARRLVEIAARIEEGAHAANYVRAALVVIWNAFEKASDFKQCCFDFQQAASPTLLQPALEQITQTAFAGAFSPYELGKGPHPARSRDPWKAAIRLAVHVDACLKNITLGKPPFEGLEPTGIEFY